ncbi:Protein of unknown function [Pyronema omphalodes CBS 100304]|uniref:Uncharacterized protein n=1 Tax=Pyronema omphalodes (strain CBS 100304) TaxID=1076935 RepID=U4LFI6_PYROM|nr:Protein of unknown function [Pyronema omphalodes CBS 100304]
MVHLAMTLTKYLRPRLHASQALTIFSSPSDYLSISYQGLGPSSASSASDSIAWYSCHLRS